MTDALPPSEAPPRLAMAMPGSADAERFIAQFGEHHRGDIVQLIVSLHPGLHHHHVRDTVREVMGVTGVALVQWPHTHSCAPVISDAVRVRLANYRVVRVGPGEIAEPPAGDLAAAAGDDGRLIALFHELTNTMLVSSRVNADLDTIVDQRHLDLADLVDQACGHEAADGARWATEIEYALQCPACRQVTALGDVRGFAARIAAGCTTAGCDGRLRPVTAAVAPTYLPAEYTR